MFRRKKYLSVAITRIFMKFIGLWYVETKKERLLSHAALGYAILAIIFAIYVEIVDLYYCFNDFYAVIYNLCATMVLIMILVKFGTFMYYREVIMKLILYAERNFWGVEYDKSSAKVLEEYNKRGILMMYSFTVLVSLSAINYIIAPLFENGGRNETNRALPFKLWVNLPVTVTPYYEIAYTIQSLSTFYSGICTFCFDNFICTFNIHVAAQLKILAQKVETVVEKYITDATDQNLILQEKAAVLALKDLQNYVLQHQALIAYIKEMERPFNIVLLGQLLLSSMIICFGGFQLIATDVPIKKYIFFVYLLGGLSQLLICTWTCNDIIVQSSGILDAAYKSKWYLISNEEGAPLKYCIIMIMMRARQPSVLKAGGFTVMSLETFTGILSTAMSYFTLLRQMSENT